MIMTATLDREVIEWRNSELQFTNVDKQTEKIVRDELLVLSHGGPSAGTPAGRLAVQLRKWGYEVTLVDGPPNKNAEF